MYMESIKSTANSEQLMNTELFKSTADSDQFKYTELIKNSSDLCTRNYYNLQLIYVQGIKVCSWFMYTEFLKSAADSERCT